MTTPIEKAIDLACGYDPAKHRIAKHADENVESLLELVAAAVVWWHSLADGITIEEHLKNPVLNCEHDEEHLLAKQIAKMVKDGW